MNSRQVSMSQEVPNELYALHGEHFKDLSFRIEGLSDCGWSLNDILPHLKCKCHLYISYLKNK